MSKLNAWMIQETLKTVKKINIAWLQDIFSLPYSSAKEMMAELERRGWVVRGADRRYWRVCPGGFFLRHLDASEYDALRENMTPDCVSAMECLRQKGASGATRAQIECAVRGVTDTDEAIRALKKLQLIHYVNGLYYSRISLRENRILTNAVQSYTRLCSMWERRGREEKPEEFARLMSKGDHDLNDDNDIVGEVVDDDDD